MSHAHRTAAAMKRGQFLWDNAAPPEDGPQECAECNGTGEGLYAGEDSAEPCEFCGGTGYVDADGFPFDPAQAERDREAQQAEQLYWRNNE